jgi:hypothetical protein
MRRRCRARNLQRLRAFRLLLLVTGVLAPRAHAQSTSDSTEPSPSEATGQKDREQGQPGAPRVALSGYLETFYQWNFGNPSNGLTNFRGFDNRHNSLTLSNIVASAQFEQGAFAARLAAQVGHTPSTYYSSEPSSAGSAGANSSNDVLWKFIQEAYASYRFALGNGLTLSAGLFLSPIGPESMAVKDNFHWSRSNLFFGLPFYHTGVRATYALNTRWNLTLAGYNGWNSVVDNNGEKSLSLQATYTRESVALSLLYFGGVERPRLAPEGRPWRHLLDAHVTWNASSRFTLLGHLNGGFEVGRLGSNTWLAASLSLQYRITDAFRVAGRVDGLSEQVASADNVRPGDIFFPAPWVASATATVEYRFVEHLSVRFEYRHDRSGEDLFFSGEVQGDGVLVPFEPNRPFQDTVTLGVVAWF